MKRVRDEENSFTSPIAVMMNDDDTESPLVSDTRVMTPSTTRDDSLLYTSSGGSGGHDGGGGNESSRGRGDRRTVDVLNLPEGHVQTLQIGHYAVPSALRYSNNNRSSNINRNSSTTPRGGSRGKDIISSLGSSRRVGELNGGNHGTNGERREGRIDESLPLASSPSSINRSTTERKETTERKQERNDLVTSPSHPMSQHSRSTNTSIIFAN